MFAMTIIDSDAFLDMPLTTQALYFHLSMRADDDGFLNNPKKIQRVVGASDDDLKLLAAKNFIIPFESGIVVIKHWKIHNYIQKDRYKATVYKEEKSMLTEKKNGAYTLDTECIQNVSGSVSQDRIGKVRLGKVRDTSSQSDSDESEEPEAKINYQEILNLYHTICKSLPSVRVLSDTRKKHIKARMKTYSMEDLKEAFTKAEASDFLTGRKGDRGWHADFEWFFKHGDNNLAKVLEGKYDNNDSGGQPQGVSSQYNFEMLERENREDFG